MPTEKKNMLRCMVLLAPKQLTRLSFPKISSNSAKEFSFKKILLQTKFQTKNEYVFHPS